jgi:phosphoribosyl 1,2-cyclic phosphodiesterase
LRGCDLLILEANHDEILLRTSAYPWSVKRRIASSHGHLSNQAAARFAVDLAHSRLAGVVLAHLSNECNRPDLARAAVEEALARAGWTGHLEVARQDAPTRWLDVEDLRTRSGPEQMSFL